MRSPGQVLSVVAFARLKPNAPTPKLRTASETTDPSVIRRTTKFAVGSCVMWTHQTPETMEKVPVICSDYQNHLGIVGIFALPQIIQSKKLRFILILYGKCAFFLQYYH